MASERTLEAILRFVLDRQSVQQVKQGSKSIENALQEIRDRAEEVERQMDEVRNWAGYFGDLSTSALFFGAALSGPILLATNQFVQQTGMADRTSRAWLSATDDLQKSYTRIGRVGAEALLPFLETAADIAGKIAAFAEEHPSALRAILFTGGTLVGLAAVGEAVERGIRIYTDAKSLFFTSQQVLAGRLMQQAANKQLAAATAMATGKVSGGIAGGAAGGAATAGGLTAAGVGLSALLGVGVGVGANELLARSQFGQAVGAQTFGKFAAVGAYGLGSLFGDETALQWFETVAKWTGEIADDAPEAEQALEASKMITQQQLETYIAFRQAEAEAEQQYEDERQSIIDRAGEQRAETEARNEERRNKLVEQYNQRRTEELQDFNREWNRKERDFEQNELKEKDDFEQDRAKVLDNARRQEKQIEATYYERRAELVASSNEEVQRVEADHQKTMRRMQEDHDLRLQDAIRQQDAVAFLREQQNYERQRQQTEEDHQEQVSQRDKATAKRLAEMEAEFQKEREARRTSLNEQLEEMQSSFEAEKKERTAAFEQSRLDAEADFNYRRDREKQHHEEMLQEFDDQAQKELEAIDQKKTEQLNQLHSQYEEEKTLRQEAFADQLRDLDAALLGEKETRQEYYAQMEEDFEKWLKNMKGKISSRRPDYPSRQSGGYVGSGLYNMHTGEFVLNPHATRTAENMIGSPLSQSNLLAALAGRGGLGGNRNMVFSPSYQFNERDDSRLIMAQIETMLDRKLMEVERGY